MKTSSPKAVRRQAAEWLARRQAHGFTPAEERAFAAWCASDARHGRTFSQLEAAWAALDKLADYPHPKELAADADFFGSSRPLSRFLLPALLAAAAGIAVGALVWFKSGPSAGPAPAPAISVATADPDFLRLPDGSEVEMNRGSKMAEYFTPEERRVRLVRGEAQFSVVKDRARPFIVEADGVAVRAIGTAFDVRLGAAAVEVLVTEGAVQVTPSAKTAFLPGPGPGTIAVVTAGQRTVVPTGAGAEAIRPRIETLASPDIDRALAWQISQLVFDATPLSEIVARVNLLLATRREGLRIALGDQEVAAIRISGRIRSDDIGTFLEALQTDFGVAVDHAPDGELILRSQPRGP